MSFSLLHLFMAQHPSFKLLLLLLLLLLLRTKRYKCVSATKNKKVRTNDNNNNNKQEGDKTHLGTSGNNVATLHNRTLFEQF